MGSPEEMAAMGRAACAEYEAKYTAEKNYPILMEIYRHAIAGRDSRSRGLESEENAPNSSDIAQRPLVAQSNS